MSGGTITLRRAEAADAAALAAFAESTFRETFAHANSEVDLSLHCTKNFSAAIQGVEIADPRTIIFLAEHDAKLAGFAQLVLGRPVDCVHADRPSELFRIYVAGEWHGKGVSIRLLLSTLEAARRAGSDYLWLGVWERNAKAIAFYRKVGFESVGEHEFLLGRDPQRDLIMGLGLE